MTREAKVVRMLVELEPVEAWVEVPDYTGDDDEVAAEIARKALLRDGIDDFVGTEGRLSIILKVKSARLFDEDGWEEM